MVAKQSVQINNSVFYLEESIGIGAQGEIFSAVNPIDGAIVAVKVIDFTKPGNMRHYFVETNSIREVKPWKFRYLCNILDFYEKENSGIIAMQKYDCDLFRYAVEELDGISEDIGARLFKKLCLGLKSMHSEGIAHLDIKPENIMYDIDSNTPYIGDFGCCYNFRLKGKCQGIRGTKQYYPPEFANGTPFNPRKADIYSLGVTLHIILTGYYPYDVQEELNDRKLYIDASLSPACRHLILKMLRNDPKKRIPLKEIMNHPWLSENTSQDSKTIKTTSTLSSVKKGTNSMLHWSLQRMNF